MSDKRGGRGARTIARATPAAPDAARDEDEVTRAAAGDTAAFERLYRQHVGRIHALVRRMLGGDDACEDVTQDVFIRVWEKLHTFRGDAEFHTWLHRLAVNVTLSHRGRAARRRARFPIGDPPPGTATRPVRPDLKMDFERALERLPDGAREVLVLHDMEGYKHHEIAALLGVAEGTSKSQLHRARMEMRRHLEA